MSDSVFVLGDAVWAQLQKTEEKLVFNFWLVESTFSCMVHLPALHSCLHAGCLPLTPLHWPGQFRGKCLVIVLNRQQEGNRMLNTYEITQFMIENTSHILFSSHTCCLVTMQTALFSTTIFYGWLFSSDFIRTQYTPHLENTVRWAVALYRYKTMISVLVFYLLQIWDQFCAHLQYHSCRVGESYI